MKTAKALVRTGNILGETPVWIEAEQALYWVDIRAPAIHRFKLGSGMHDRWSMPEFCCAIVPAEGQGLVVAFRQGIAHFDPATGRIVRLAEIEAKGVDNRLNEAKCDRVGRLWIGSMRDFGAAIEGSLYRVGPDLKPDRLMTDIRVPNSLGWSPDNETMYFADTSELTLNRYTYDLARGTMGEAATFLDASIPGRPDGCAVDAEGFVWNARFGSGEVIRISPVGEIVDRVRVDGAAQVTSCALGGPDLKTLFITSAKQKLGADALAQQPCAGDLFAVRVEVSGLPEPGFRFDRTIVTR
jgi:sugar lactone lactonase YvrE